MDVNGDSHHYFYLNNEVDRESVEIVKAAPGIVELGHQATKFFDTYCITLESEQILTHFTDEKAHSLILADGRFNQDLFRAATLFGLSIVPETEIPAMVERLASFWTSIKGAEPEEYPALFGPYCKNPYNSPYDAMKEFVIAEINEVTVDRLIEQDASHAEPADPLQEEIDGAQFKVIGLPEREDTDALTGQLLRDLRKLYPTTVIQELERLRFTPDMTEADIIPMIERIQAERANGVVPDAEELVAGYLHHSGKLNQRFHLRGEETRTPDEIRQAAIQKIDELRSKQARQRTVSAYIPLLDEYVTYTETDPEDGNPCFVEEAFVGIDENARVRDLTTEEWEELFTNPVGSLARRHNPIHRG